MALSLTCHFVQVLFKRLGEVHHGGSHGTEDTDHTLQVPPAPHADGHPLGVFCNIVAQLPV